MLAHMLARHVTVTGLAFAVGRRAIGEVAADRQQLDRAAHRPSDPCPSSTASRRDWNAACRDATVWRCSITLRSSALSAAASGTSEMTTGVENSGTISESVLMAPLYTRTGDGGVERPARPRLEIERVGPAQPQPLDAGPGDHGAVVGAELYRRRDQTGAMLGGEPLPGGRADRGWPRRRPPRTSVGDGATRSALAHRSAKTSPTVRWNEAQRSATIARLSPDRASRRSGAPPS